MHTTYPKVHVSAIRTICIYMLIIPAPSIFFHIMQPITCHGHVFPPLSNFLEMLTFK